LTSPRRIPRAEHPISRSMISSGTLKTLYALKEAGFEAYLVGGGVRDLLAGIEPKDFDVATNAHPEQVRRLFRSCRMVGRRFVICHVRHGDEITEVTTFRGPVTESHERDETGRILSDNQYGTLEEDAYRRDFTVNALYYDIRDFAIVEFAQGVEDLQAGLIRLIGDPELRYREDPVRMLRAVRIANKLRFRLVEETAAPISQLASTLRDIPAARLFDELLKMLLSRDAVDNLYGLRVYGLCRQLFPVVDRHLDDPRWLRFVNAALRNTAERIAQDQTVSPAFLFASLLWPAVVMRARILSNKQGLPEPLATAQASEEVIAKTAQTVAIPKRFSIVMREIWQLQSRFEQRSQSRVRRFLTHPRFRAAYDFLMLRALPGDDTALRELADWWTEAQATAAAQGVVIGEADADDDDSGEPRKKRRRRRGGRRRKGPMAGGQDAAPPAP